MMKPDEKQIVSQAAAQLQVLGKPECADEIVATVSRQSEAWKKVKLGEIITIKHGYAFAGEHIIQEDNGIVLVTPGNFRIGGGFQQTKCKFYDGSIPEGYILKAGDLIVTMTDLSKTIDTLGYSAIVPKSNTRIYLHNQRIGLVNVVGSDCDKAFICLAMQTREYQRAVANTSTGATVHHTSPSKIYDIDISLPPLATQKKIASILFAYDNLIANYQRQIKLLEEAAQRLYKEWFVDLHFPGHENVKVIDGVPEGWEKTNINAIVTFHRGYDLTKAQMVDGKYPVLGSTSIIGYHKSYKIKGPGIVTGRSGSLGKYQLVEEDFWPHNTSLYISDFKGHNVYYVFNMLQTVDFSLLNNGGAIPILNRNVLSNISILEPAKVLQRQFASMVEPMYKKIHNLSRQLSLLTESRDRLLPKLMSGEIELKM